MNSILGSVVPLAMFLYLTTSNMNLSTSQDAGIHVGQVMQFACTLELSAPKDLAKMYNFVSFVIIVTIIEALSLSPHIILKASSSYLSPPSLLSSNILTNPSQNKVKSNLPRDDINLQFCRGVLKDKRAMLEEMKVAFQRYENRNISSHCRICLKR